MRYILYSLITVGAAYLSSNSFAQENKSLVQLTSQEQLFINNHASITLGSGESFAPFTIKTRDNKIEGFDADILALISKRTGLKIKLKQGNWLDIQQQGNNKKIDGISTAAYDKERTLHYSFSEPYIKLYPIVIVKDGNPKNIFSVEDLNNKTVALQRSNLLFKKSLTDSKAIVNIRYYDALSDLIKAVVSEEVDFTILDASFYYLSTIISLDEMVETRFILGDQASNLHFATRNDQPEINSIINKGLASISSAEFLKIHSRWFAHKNTSDQTLEKIIPLTISENNYLKKRGILKVCVLNNSLPVERISKSGIHEGMGKDLLFLITTRLGIQTKLVPIANWSEMTRAIVQKRCDIKILAQEPNLLHKNIMFTSPIINIPIAIFAKKNQTKIKNLNDLSGTRLAVLKDSKIEKYFKDLYPEIDLIRVSHPKDGINLVNQNRVKSFVGSDIVTRRIIQKEGVVDLHIIATLPFQVPLGIASHADEPKLHRILQKVVNLLPEDSKHNIYQKWDGITYDNDINYTLIKNTIVFSIIVISLILFWTNTIRRERNKTKDALKKLEQTTVLLEQNNKKLKYLSITDPLTGLCNRTRINEVIDNECNRAQRHHATFGIMIIDIDFFKNVNDIYGHLVGDEVLVALAEILISSTRDIDTVGRWGGEEFFVICPHSLPEGLEQLAERIRVNVMEAPFSNGIHLTVSIGIASTNDEHEIHSIVSRADSALYLAKDSGRNKICVG